MFPFTCCAISEWYVEILTKVENNNIHVGCLVPFSLLKLNNIVKESGKSDRN